VSDNNDGILHIESGGGTVAFDGFDNVGIGFASPTTNLDVNGSALVRGSLTVWGSFSNPSDARLKRDVKPLEGALEKLLALRGVEFDWQHEGLARLRPGRQAGLIADEVAEVFPSWVRHDPGTDMKLVSPQGFEALMIEALRELANRIEALEANNQRLSQMLEAPAGGEAAATDGPQSRRGKGKPAQPETRETLQAPRRPRDG
jgi:hypothetical protein